MKYQPGERISDPDTFQKLRVGKIIQHGVSLKDSYKLAKVSREIQFGFNRKQDNFAKTKQLKLDFL